MKSGGFLLKMFFPIPSLTRRKRSSSSSSRRSFYSDNSSSSIGSSKSDNSSMGSTKPLLKKGRNGSADKSSNGNFAKQTQHEPVDTNCRRRQSGCYPLFHNQDKRKIRSI
uniref:Uncharacterized protein n=1 Tax=Narcissus pseudonarcissus TaxID=39639 RepID=Q8W138_NARPS|nr:hypothetical protein [Narcissus pseudonarcissus]